MGRRSSLTALFVLLCLALVACSTVLGFDDLLGAPADAGPGLVLDANQDPADVIVIDSPTGVGVIVSASQNPSTYGSAVSFTAVAAGNMGIPTGTVTFTDGATSLGKLALDPKEGVGRAVLTTSALTAGKHTITATYDGDSRYASGSAGSAVIDVQKALTITTLVSTPNPAPADQTITLTATVSTTTSLPLPGNVTFKDGATTLGTSAVNSGKAVLKMPLAGGLHPIVATYEGNGNLAASSSAVLSQSMTGPGCQGVPVSCGSGGNANCCSTSVVPGGTFSRSFDGVTYNNAANTATVSAFALDKFEVTVGRYRAFVAAGRGTALMPPAADEGAHPLIPSSGWAFDANLPADTAALTTALKCTSPAGYPTTWTDAPGANELKPMTCLNWYDAFAFCAWDGGRLPTEAEWNFAAAAGDQQRVRPFSNPPSSTAITFAEAVYFAPGSLPVGSRPAGDALWGQSDMSGNVWEWVLDYSIGGGSSPTMYPNPCTDCANLTVNGNRIIRGGGYVYNEFDTTASRRQAGFPAYRGSDVGVRCARAP